MQTFRKGGVHNSTAWLFLKQCASKVELQASFEVGIIAEEKGLRTLNRDQFGPKGGKQQMLATTDAVFACTIIVVAKQAALSH